ncbi:MAG: maleylpyruvate isomerase family mycothiol-dependent enzyme [Nocardioidaceae bacterium]
MSQTSLGHSVDPYPLLEVLGPATSRLLQAVRGLSDADLRHTSRLPGWTRGHVLSHLARNADALVNLYVSAATGEERPMYASPQRRNADIDEGAGRSLGELLDDLAESHDRMTAAAARVHHSDWSTVVRPGGQRAPMAAAVIPLLRLAEVEIHHVDLDIAYRPADWSGPWLEIFLPQAASGLSARAGQAVRLVATDTGSVVDGGAGPATEGSADGGGSGVADRAEPTLVTGTSAELLAWITGRSGGSVLDLRPGDRLPSLPSWR